MRRWRSTSTASPVVVDDCRMTGCGTQPHAHGSCWDGATVVGHVQVKASRLGCAVSRETWSAKHDCLYGVSPLATAHGRHLLNPNCTFCAGCLGADIGCEFFCASGAAAATVELRALLDRERQVMDVALDV